MEQNWTLAFLSEKAEICVLHDQLCLQCRSVYDQQCILCSSVICMLPGSQIYRTRLPHSVCSFMGGGVTWWNTPLLAPSSTPVCSPSMVAAMKSWKSWSLAPSWLISKSKKNHHHQEQQTNTNRVYTCHGKVENHQTQSENFKVWKSGSFCPKEQKSPEVWSKVSQNFAACILKWGVMFTTKAVG